ncbi:MAG: CapA family protein [bacterium]
MKFPIKTKCIFFFLILSIRLFSQDKTDTFSIIKDTPRRFTLKETNPIKTICLSFVGDLQMGGSCLPVIQSKGYDYPFDSTRILISRSDLAVANLEAPFVLQGKPFNKKFTFLVHPEWAAGALRAGFNVFTLANNHILDYGPEGLATTIQTLDSMQIKHCGAGENIDDAEKPCLVTVNNWKIAFFAFSLTYPAEFWANKNKPGTAYPHLKRIKSQIKKIRDNCDLIVVAFHWGGELWTFPKPYQIFYAHKVIDFGADIVIGHHPHVVQGMEFYKDKFIAYSLGNYVFGSYSRKVSFSIILQMRYDNRGLLYAEVIPIDVFNPRVQFCPTIIRKKKRGDIIEELNTISLKFNNNKKIIRKSGLIVHPEQEK